MSMKTLLRLIKRSFVFRLCYRLVCWINYPTPRERMWHMFALGKAQGRKEALKELPIVRVQPAHPRQTAQLHLPPGVWAHEWRRELHERGKATASRVLGRLGVEPTKDEPPQDDSWLNSTPRKQDDPDNTEKVPAIMKLKHATRKLG